MTSQQRRDLSNAIWLCSSCSVKIDRDVERYPAGVLCDWKTQAEHRAVVEQGKRQPSESDGTDQLIMAMTGHPAKFLPSAMANVHKATASVLQTSDPRFCVVTSHVDGVSTIGLHARETVPFSMLVPAEQAQAWNDGLRGVMEHGLPVKLSLAGTSVRGLPILETALKDGLLDPHATLSITPHGVNAMVKLAFQDPSSSMPLQFDDVPGKISFGQKAFNFAGSCCSDIVHISVRVNVGEERRNASCTVALNLNSWNGLDVLHLAHFEKVFKFCEALASEWEIMLFLEVQGETLTKGRVTFPAAEHAYYSGVNNYLGYLKRARALSRHTGVEVLLNGDNLFSRDDHVRLEEVVSIFEGRRVFGREQIRSWPVAQLVANDGAANIRDFIENSGDRDVAFQLQSQDIEVFGARIRLPDVEIKLIGVKPRVDADVSEAKAGDVVQVCFEPNDDFQGVCRFLGPRSASL